MKKVSIIALIWAKTLVKTSECLLVFCNKIESGVSAIKSKISVTQSQAKATISLRAIQQIKPIKFSHNPNIGFGYTALPYNTGQYNTAVGYQAGYAYAGSGLHINKTNPGANSIQFNNKNSQPVLVITQDGDVEWHGKPSEAADALTRTFQFAVEDMKGVTKAARRRYYHRACKNILNKAEKMEHEEFLDFLRKQVYNKERRVLVDALQGRL
jgi:hypothetical protein